MTQESLKRGGRVYAVLVTDRVEVQEAGVGRVTNREVKLLNPGSAFGNRSIWDRWEAEANLARTPQDAVKQYVAKLDSDLSEIEAKRDELLRLKGMCKAVIDPDEVA